MPTRNHLPEVLLRGGPRVCDADLAERIEAFGAVHITGPKWCGKTTTGKVFANSVIEMQDPDRGDAYLQTAKVKPSNLLAGDNPRLIDEWQEAPELWDAVRVSVDRRGEDGLYLLTGSRSVDRKSIHHTGTGRIDTMAMYPMSLFESGESNGSVSLGELFDSPARAEADCVSDLSVDDLIFAACRGGWPSSLRKDSKSIVGGCRFWLFETIAGKKLTENQMTIVFAGKTVKAAGFKSKKSTKLEARMRLNAAKDRIEFVWGE